MEIINKKPISQIQEKQQIEKEQILAPAFEGLLDLDLKITELNLKVEALQKQITELKGDGK